MAFKEAKHEFYEKLELHSNEVQLYWIIVNPEATTIVHSFDFRPCRLDNRDTGKLHQDDQDYRNMWVGKLHASVDRLDRPSGTLEDIDDTKLLSLSFSLSLHLSFHGISA